MNREEAERALGIIRKVIEETREDLVAHNWGRIWLTHAFTNSLGFAAVGYLVERRGLGVFWYLAPLAVVAAVNLVLILALAKRDQGVRSFVETQMHGIWLTFIAASIAGAGWLHLGRAPAPLFGSLLSTTASIGFTMMGVVFHRRFLASGAAFLLVALAAPLIPGVQWYLIAVVMWASLFLPGLDMDREKRKRDRDGAGTRIL